MLASEGGGQIALHNLGGKGPPLLFVHATGFNGRTYGPFVERLTEHFTVWAPDLRSHGWSSSPTNGDYEWTSLAKDILCVVDYLEIDDGQLDCVGHSIGAATLLLADAERRGLIRRMYGYEPVMWRPGEAFPAGENPLIAGAQKRREVFGSRGEAFERFSSRPPFSSCRADALYSYVSNAFEDLEDGSVRLRCRGDEEAKVYDGERVSTNDKIVDCEAKVLIGRGMDQGFGNLGMPAAEALANAETIVYEDLTHFGPLEAPDRLAADALRVLLSA
ncbi:MAG: hypothetical protein CL460_08090 [Acidimicrobiaceae bacterium]|nr:hypothetical protein [Acidimicrobiaceae bacterium]